MHTDTHFIHMDTKVDFFFPLQMFYMVLRERVEQNVVRGPWRRVWGTRQAGQGLSWRFLEWTVGTAKAGRAGGGSPSPGSACTGGWQGEVWWGNHILPEWQRRAGEFMEGSSGGTDPLDLHLQISSQCAPTSGQPRVPAGVRLVSVHAPTSPSLHVPLGRAGLILGGPG